jgi:hypothetical protein
MAMLRGLAVWSRGAKVATVYGLPADGSAPKSLAPWDGREVAMDQPAYELGAGAQVRSPTRVS